MAQCTQAIDLPDAVIFGQDGTLFTYCRNCYKKFILNFKFVKDQMEFSKELQKENQQLKEKIEEQAEEIRILQEKRQESSPEETQTSEGEEEVGFSVDKKLIEAFLQMCLISNKAAR
jgi:hypothetical protein